MVHNLSTNDIQCKVSISLIPGKDSINIDIWDDSINIDRDLEQIAGLCRALPWVFALGGAFDHA